MNPIFFLNILLVSIHIWGGILLCGRFFFKNKISASALIAGPIAAVASVCFVSFADVGDNRTLILASIETACMWIFSIRIGKADKRMGLFICIFYEIAQHLFSLLCSSVPAILYKDKSFLDTREIKGCLVFLAWAVLVCIACGLAYYLKNISSHIWMRISSAVALIAMFAINLLLTADQQIIDKEDLYSWMFFAVGLMFFVFALQMNRQYEMEKELAEMKSDEAQMLEREYRSLSNSYESNAKLFHDFRNHCGVIKNYLVKGKNEEALDYLNELTGNGSSYSHETWTGDETIDYLIGSKKTAAEEKGIHFEAEAEFPRNINIKSSDLCAILGNLLDNAIEACVKIEDRDKRKIHLIIRRIRHMLIVKVENSYDDKPVVIDGEYKTSKTDGGLHGWGIKSARAAAEKYDGIVQSSCKDNVFVTVVTLSYLGIKTES
ncbi:MAG: sensor histidine kinase [Lachnospiraceae bacterium]|nr:sensor histidine kinase [Lachnospiraceae bacterium]